MCVSIHLFLEIRRQLEQKCIQQLLFLRLSLGRCRSAISPMILLTLHPTYLTNKNPQRLKINHGMCPVGHKDQSIDWSERVFVEISRLCNFCGSYYDCCLTMHISFSLVLLNRRTIIIIFNFSILWHCNTEFWSLSPSIFSFRLFFFFFKLGLIGSGLGLKIFHKMSPRTHHNHL